MRRATLGGRLAQHLPVAAVPGVVEGVAEGDLEVAAHHRIGVGDEFQCGQGPFVVAGRLLEGEAVERPISGLPGVVHPPGGFSGGRGLHEMTGQHFESAAPNRCSMARPILRCSRSRATVGSSS